MNTTPTRLTRLTRLTHLTPLTRSQEEHLLALFHNGAYAELQQQLDPLIRRFPDMGFAWKLLGASLQLEGKNAMAALENAARLLPLDAEARCNLGVAYKQAGELAPAIANYQKALAINPGFVQAHCYLANAQRELGQWPEALASARRALEIAPQFSTAHAVMGNILKQIGQFGPALDSMRQAITITLRTYRLATSLRAGSLEHHRTHTPMSVPLARMTLDILKARLEAAGIAWCLFAGTLLGVMRDGDLLPYDKDMDIALPGTVDRQRVVQVLTSGGEFQRIFRSGCGAENATTDPAVYDLCFVHTRHRIGVDLFFWHPDGPNHFLVGPYHPVQSVLSRIERFDVGLHLWRDAFWPIPITYETYFENTYGPDWRQPDPHYDTIISNPSRIAEAIPVVLCYGYAKLYSHLLDRNWQASHAYGRQLRTRVTDRVLDDVVCWTGQQLGNLSNPW